MCIRANTEGNAIWCYVLNQEEECSEALCEIMHPSLIVIVILFALDTVQTIMAALAPFS